MVQIASWSIGMFLHSLSLFLLERRGKCGAREKGNGRENMSHVTLKLQQSNVAGLRKKMKKIVDC